MTALATTAELAAWMQTDESALPATAPAVLDMVSAIVRAEARQNFTRGTTTVTMYPDVAETWNRTRLRVWVHLPQRPVISVSAVTDENGSPVDFQLRRDTLTLARDCEWVKVTYTHGYSEVPGDVKAVALSAATRVLTNPLDIRQEAVGSISMTYAAETIGASLSPADKDLLARYRRRAAVIKVG
ncbi:hypothetical protein [Streptomyces sp. NRRL S-475]|uniref:hypothetical protein n=1 Tax=Streptomyces sp. NRRL S-475 TaxID=1463910 RepID=UPI00067AA419|nr:hypothetical protein [Streptomyces sp. NRRL S-475]